jgi:outer membrane protein
LAATLALTPTSRVRAEESTGTSLTLREALRSAERDPPSVKAALAGVVRADAQRGYVRGTYLPSLIVQGSGGASYDNQQLVPDTPRIDSKSLTVQGSATLDWALLDAVRGFRLDEAQADLQGERFAAEEAKRAAMQVAADLYVRAEAAAALELDASLTVERRTDQTRAIRDLVRAGQHPPVDAARADVELANARHMLVARRIEVRAAIAGLATALGRAPSTELRPEGDAAALELSMPPARAREEAIRNRPELRRLAASVASHRASYDAALWARLPTAGVTLTGTASYQHVLAGFGIEGPVYQGSAVAYLRWNAFDPQVWGKAPVAEAGADEAKRALEAGEAGVAAEAVAAAFAADEARDEVDRATEVLVGAEAVLEAQTGRYRAGVGSLVELLDAEALEQEARVGRIVSRRDYQLAGIRLLSSCGLLGHLAR